MISATPESPVVPASHPRLEGRRALVTGSDTHVGRAIVEALEREGARVVGVTESHETSTEDEARIVVDDAIAALGSIDILVVNPVETNEESVYMEGPIDFVLKHNVYPLFRLSKALDSQLRPGTAIITTATPDPIGSERTVSESKAGLESFMYSLGKALASRGVRVNAVVPEHHESFAAVAEACVRLAAPESTDSGATLLVA